MIGLNYFCLLQNDIEAAREAYDAFLAHYPYCYGYWRKYADYEKRKGSKKKCEEVCQMSFCISIEWALNFVLLFAYGSIHQNHRSSNNANAQNIYLFLLFILLHIWPLQRIFNYSIELSDLLR